MRKKTILWNDKTNDKANRIWHFLKIHCKKLWSTVAVWSPLIKIRWRPIELFLWGFRLQELRNNKKIQIVSVEIVCGRSRECVNTELVWEFKRSFPLMRVSAQRILTVLILSPHLKPGYCYAIHKLEIKERSIHGTYIPYYNTFQWYNKVHLKTLCDFIVFYFLSACKKHFSTKSQPLVYFQHILKIFPISASIFL